MHLLASDLRFFYSIFLTHVTIFIYDEETLEDLAFVIPLNE